MQTLLLARDGILGIVVSVASKKHSKSFPHSKLWQWARTDQNLPYDDNFTDNFKIGADRSLHINDLQRADREGFETSYTILLKQYLCLLRITHWNYLVTILVSISPELEWGTTKSAHEESITHPRLSFNQASAIRIDCPS